MTGRGKENSHEKGQNCVAIFKGKNVVKKKILREDRAKWVFIQEKKKSILVPCSGLGWTTEKNPTKTKQKRAFRHTDPTRNYYCTT